MKLFVDTWGWIALANRADPEHSPAVECFERSKQATGLVWTSNFVLDETITLLFLRTRPTDALSFANRLMHSPFIRVETVTEERFRNSFELRTRFVDKPKISFTDLTSMSIMKELDIENVLTADAHFMHVGLGFHRLPA
ncbi:MAG TPA: PIN domain-containing protein [Candidatus Acidoferrales bacterium]|nr:PIN domain-containing protein [Candidatus Acidoferrales bacterium]